VTAPPTELQAYARELGWILEQVGVSLRGLTAAQLNWRPATGTANSAWAIVTHVVSATRVYALGFGCGRPVSRDRPAEFAAAGSSPETLLADVASLARELETALRAMPPAELERRTLPSQELWGTGAPHELSRREALVESIRHAALHLGELRLTRDLALRQAPA
jgi:DinB superfamily